MSTLVPAPAALTEARATHRRVGRTFWLASRLLPADRRDDVHLLYLVLRTLDDAVDERDPAAGALVDEVDAWCDGAAPNTQLTATLAAIDAHHRLPREAVHDFCTGMRTDLAGPDFATEAEVDEYCYQVAGTVGLLMTAILGARDPGRARGPAIALGQAMQRTNILRDLDEDHHAGRRYVSAEAIARHGWPYPGARAEFLREQIAEADRRYDEGIAGIGELSSGRLAVAAAAGMYREILRELERQGLGARPGRAVAPLSRKLLAAGHTWSAVRAAR